MDGIVIRDAAGNYRKGDVLTGKDMAKFLKTNANPDAFHAVTLPNADAADTSAETPLNKEPAA